MSITHWGEIPKKKYEPSIPNIMNDIERCMNQFCLAEYEDENDAEITENIVLPSMDPLMLYAISLHKYANDMTGMIKVADVVTDTILMIPQTAPPMPIAPEINFGNNSFNYTPKDLRSYDADSNVIELSKAIAKKILAKSIATMFAHIGFETTHQSVLDVLTDVLEAFFQKICAKVVDATNAEDHGESSGFPSVIERVLTDIGMGGIEGLNDYYQNRVIKYIGVLQKRCKELNDHYASLAFSKTTELVDTKTEEGTDMSETSNPEMHFASFDGNSSLALESGLELLNTLEAEGNLLSG